LIRKASKLLLAIPIALSLLAFPATSQAQDTDTAPQTAEEVVAAMQPGWNLGNTFDAMCCSEGADETAWGNPRVTEAQLEAIRAQGFNSIRIPVSWGNHQGPSPDYTIDPAVMARVQEVVDWALADGFYVMINIHHDSWQWVNHLPTQHDEVRARYDATWTQIATAFKDYPPELVLESVNEPFFDGTSGDAENHQYLAELNASFHSIVRGTGGGNADRLLVLPTLRTNADQQHLDALAAEITALNDPMIAATTHNYGFWPFSVNVAGYTEFDAEVAGYLEGDFDRLYDTFVSKGVPMIVGEYGLLGFDRHTGTVEQGEKLKFFEYFGYLARSRGVTTMWWDNGQHFDRNTFQWRDQALFDQIASSWTTRSGTASSDQVYVDATDPITDKTVTLNTNGLSFSALYSGDTKLQNRKDYVVRGSTLTLKAGLLSRILGDRSHGVHAQLSVRFSGGVPWTLNVISYDTPVLEHASGTTASLAIPTAFNGDQLATMEAKYSDGTNAGPHDWTSFKEFAVTFEPDYAAGQIELTQTFFNEVNDNSTVILTFHFRSGETVQYTLTRNGTAVTGTA
jgi:endoglucanase